MKFTNEQYAMSDMMDIVHNGMQEIIGQECQNESRLPVQSNIEERGMPYKIKSKRNAGEFIVRVLLEGTYFDEHRDHRLHYVVEEIRKGSVPLEIAKQMIKMVRGLHTSSTCTECEEDKRLYIPSDDDIVAQYEKKIEYLAC